MWHPLTCLWESWTVPLQRSLPAHGLPSSLQWPHGLETRGKGLPRQTVCLCWSHIKSQQSSSCWNGQSRVTILTDALLPVHTKLCQLLGSTFTIWPQCPSFWVDFPGHFGPFTFVLARCPNFCSSPHLYLYFLFVHLSTHYFLSVWSLRALCSRRSRRYTARVVLLPLNPSQPEQPVDFLTKVKNRICQPSDLHDFNNLHMFLVKVF